MISRCQRRGYLPKFRELAHKINLFSGLAYCGTLFKRLAMHSLGVPLHINVRSQFAVKLCHLFGPLLYEQHVIVVSEVNSGRRERRCSRRA